MTTLDGAVPGWTPRGRLTALSTPDAARAALRAEAETSVLDPVGMRRLWLRELYLVLAVCVAVLMVVASVQYLRDGASPRWWFPLVVLVVLPLRLTQAWALSLCRAIPGPGVVPRLGPARLRWYARLGRAPAPAPTAPAAWPPGSEAYAVLSGAGSVEAVTATWLFERIGLHPAVGRQWVAVLLRQGWLTGGGRVLGMERLPELHLTLTEEGRSTLGAERARLQALAAR